MVDISFLTNISIDTAYAMLSPLALFMAGVTVYSVFIFKLYKIIASRDVFEGKPVYKGFKQRIKSSVGQGTITRVFLHTLEYIFLFPLVVFFFSWFFFLLLLFLAEGVPASTLMLTSVAIVGAVRITSYYSEDLSQDLAKMLPLALLGMYITALPRFSFTESVNAVLASFTTPETIKLLVYYFLFLVILEFTMRVVHFIYSAFTRKPYMKQVEE